MQEEWTDKLRDQLNHELELDGITADSKLIQKTLQRIKEAELLDEEFSENEVFSAVQPCSENKETKEVRKKQKSFPQYFFAAAAVMLCLIVVRAALPQLFQKSKDAEMNEHSIKPTISGDENFSGTSGTEDMADGAKPAIDTENNQANSEGMQENESQMTGGETTKEDASAKDEKPTDQELSKDSNIQAEKEAGIGNIEAKENLIVLKHPDRIALTAPDGQQLLFQISEAAGIFLYDLLKTAVPAQLAAKEGWSGTEFREESETFICKIQLLEGETEQQLILYQGGFLTSQEQIENRVVWWLEGSEKIEELFNEGSDLEEKDEKMK